MADRDNKTLFDVQCDDIESLLRKRMLIDEAIQTLQTGSPDRGEEKAKKYSSPSSGDSSLPSIDSTGSWELIDYSPNDYPARVFLQDVNDDTLFNELQVKLQVAYLSETVFPDVQFPAIGRMIGLRKRLLVNLVVKLPKPSTGEEYPVLNVAFIVDTGSPLTFLCPTAICALAGVAPELRMVDGKKKVIRLPPYKHKEIQSSFLIRGPNGKRVYIPYEESPQKSEELPEPLFPDANLLGQDALAKLRLSIDFNWDTDEFQLVSGPLMENGWSQGE